MLVGRDFPIKLKMGLSKFLRDAHLCWTYPVVCRVKVQGGYTELALGQGQTQAALEALQAAATAGGWLCIKNTHLAVTWLPELHRKLADVATSAAPGFRLWMTSEPHEMFPPGLLSACLVRQSS